MLGIGDLGGKSLHEGTTYRYILEVPRPHATSRTPKLFLIRSSQERSETLMQLREPASSSVACNNSPRNDDP